MSQFLQDRPPPLLFARVRNSEDPHVKEFLHACENNLAAKALHLALENAAEALTVGLNSAIKGGHVDLARQLIKLGAAWDSRTIHYASESLEAVEMLVEAGFDVNTPLIGGGVLLPLVVLRNNEPCIRFLLQHGANPNLGASRFSDGDLSQIFPMSNSGNALNYAAGFCSTEIFALLLSHGAELSNAIPLHYAAGHARSVHEDVLSDVSRVPMLEYLVGLGLDINAKDDKVKIYPLQRGTPLHYAVKFYRLEEARWLLKNGADPDIPDNWGFSARDRAEKLLEGCEMRNLLCPSELQQSI